MLPPGGDLEGFIKNVAFESGLKDVEPIITKLFVHVQDNRKKSRGEAVIHPKFPHSDGKSHTTEIDVYYRFQKFLAFY